MPRNHVLQTLISIHDDENALPSSQNGFRITPGMLLASPRPSSRPVSSYTNDCKCSLTFEMRDCCRYAVLLQVCQSRTDDLRENLLSFSEQALILVPSM